MSIKFYRCPDCGETFTQLEHISDHMGTDNCIAHDESES